MYKLCSAKIEIDNNRRVIDSLDSEFFDNKKIIIIN